MTRFEDDPGSDECFKEVQPVVLRLLKESLRARDELEMMVRRKRARGPHTMQEDFLAALQGGGADEEGEEGDPGGS